MPTKIPLKLLLQHRDDPSDEYPDRKRFRITALIDAETVVTMLTPLARSGAQSTVVKAEMPSEDMEVHLEIMEPNAATSALTYTKHLQENGWTTDHVTLVRG